MSRAGARNPFIYSATLARPPPLAGEPVIRAPLPDPPTASYLQRRRSPRRGPGPVCGTWRAGGGGGRPGWCEHRTKVGMEQRGGAGSGMVKTRGGGRNYLTKFPLHRRQVLLLLPDRRSRPHRPYPPHRLPRCEAEPPHQVHRGQRASAAPPRRAVHRDRARRSVGDGEEAEDGGGRGRGLVAEGEAVVCDAGGGEGRRVVGGRIEPDDGGGAEHAQDRHEEGRGEVPHAARVAVGCAGEVSGPAERDQLAVGSPRAGRR